MIYSHSRLSTFEQCRYKFKLKYIDKVEPEQQTIEAFLGSRVHETLEKLYKDLLHRKENTVEDLIEYLHHRWRDQWNDSIIIVKKQYTKENYLQMAEKYIKDYYETYHPFQQERTISLEQRVMIPLDESGDYKLQGVIDRLAERKPGFYEIHDYKTNMHLPLPKYIQSDRQLALYAIGVKNQYPHVKHVRLIWHFLAFNKEIDSTRTEEELNQLKQETMSLIDIIESEEKYPASPSFLCEWCEFKTICKEWSHLYKSRENEYLNDPGVKLVDRYAELKRKQKQVSLELYAELEKLEEAIISFAEREGVDVVFGSNNKIRIKDVIRYKFPSKHSRERRELIEVLKQYGKLEEVSQLDTSSLNKIILEKHWDEDLLEAIKRFVEVERSKRLYLSKLKNDEEHI